MCRLVADSATLSYLGAIFIYSEVVRFPPMKKGVLRSLKAEADKAPWGTHFHLSLPYNPEKMSLNMYVKLIKQSVYTVENAGHHVTVIWPLLERMHSPSQIRSLRNHARRFRIWMKAKRLLGTIVVPKLPIPSVHYLNYRGDPRQIFGNDFIQKLRRDMPVIPEREEPPRSRSGQCPTIPLAQDLRTFLTLKRA